jgi:hypothetical protein
MHYVHHHNNCWFSKKKKPSPKKDMREKDEMVNAN